MTAPASVPAVQEKRYATGLFPTGNPADPVESRRVLVLETWEALQGAAVVEVCEKGIPKLPTTARHVLPFARLASDSKLTEKREAYARKLSTVLPGYCPHCWFLGKAIPAPIPEDCPFSDAHPRPRPPVSLEAAA